MRAGDTCKVCGGCIQNRKEKDLIYMGMGRWRNKTVLVPYCPYCEWKGNTGAGRDLRQIIANK